VIHVSNRPHVHVRLAAFELLFRHDVTLFMGCAQLSTGIAQSRDPVNTAALRADKTIAPPALRVGAHDRNRTGDLVLTKDVLYRLSYVGKLSGAGSGNRTHVISLEG
jgi:hypothetical protein